MFKKFIHISLAISVLLSTGGFWTNSHFCKNELTKTSFFLILGSCCSSDSSPCSAEKMSCSNEEHDDRCCDNNPKFNKLDQDQLNVKSEFKSFEKLVNTHFVIPTSNTQIPLIDKNHLKFYKYVPPPIVLDYQVRLQTFLC